MTKKFRHIPVDLSQYGCTDAVQGLQNVLLDRIEQNISDGILVHKRIDVFINGTLGFRLDENLTKPPEDKFIVTDFNDYNDTFFCVKLRDPRQCRRKPIKRKLVIEGDAGNRYGKRKQDINLFLNPSKIENSLLKNITGLGRGQFGAYCRQLAKVGIKVVEPRRKLSLPCIALLERCKSHQGLSNRFMTAMFNAAYGTIYNMYWDVQLKRFIHGDHWIKVWTTAWLDDAQKEVQIEKIRNMQSPQQTLFLDSFKDPRPNSNRRAFGIQIDSCKKSIQSSNDFEFQKSTYFSPYGKGNYVSCTNFCSFDGTCILHSEPNTSISPMSGDRRILSHLLHMDLEAFRQGIKPRNGTVNLMSGTSQSFCVGFLDQGEILNPTSIFYAIYSNQGMR